VSDRIIDGIRIDTAGRRRDAFDVARDFVREQAQGEWGDEQIDEDAVKLARVLLAFANAPPLPRPSQRWRCGMTPLLSEDLRLLAALSGPGGFTTREAAVHAGLPVGRAETRKWTAAFVHMQKVGLVTELDPLKPAVWVLTAAGTAELATRAESNQREDARGCGERDGGDAHLQPSPRWRLARSQLDAARARAVRCGS